MYERNGFVSIEESTIVPRIEKPDKGMERNRRKEWSTKCGGQWEGIMKRKKLTSPRRRVEWYSLFFCLLI